MNVNGNLTLGFHMCVQCVCDVCVHAHCVCMCMCVLCASSCSGVCFLCCAFVKQELAVLPGKEKEVESLVELYERELREAQKQILILWQTLQEQKINCKCSCIRTLRSR